MRRWLARWRAALRIARRDAWRSKGRTVLVVLLMMLPVAAGTFVVGVLRSSTPTTATTISWEMGDTAQARLALPCAAEVRTPTKQDASGMGACGAGGADLGELTESELAAAVPSGDGVSPAAEAYLDLRTDQALIDGAQVLETDTSAVPGLLGEVTGHAVPAAGQVVLRSGVAERLQVGVGDSVELMLGEEPEAVQVVGIGTSTSRTAALLGPGTLPDGGAQPVWFVTGDAPVTWADVVQLNAIGLVVISRAVLNDPPPPAEVYGGMFGGIAGDGGRLAGTLLAVGGLVLLEIILLIGPAFAVGAKRSARSLALVASAGGEPADLRRIVLAGGVVAGLVAAVLGMLVGTAASLIVYAVLVDSQTPAANLVIPLWEPVAIGAIALVLGVAAAWFPARSASRADVVTVLAGRRGEQPARHRVAWIGLGLGALGVVLSIVAAVTSQPVLLAGGVIVLELGLVMAAGALVALAGRLAPRFGVAGRFALRDAHRHRSRTAPAVAAVLAAVAAATAGMIWITSHAQVQEQVWKPVAADGTGLLSLDEWGASAEALDEQYQQATEVISAAYPEAVIAPVQNLTRTDETAGPNPVAMPDPETECPDPALMGPDAADERCRVIPTISSGYNWAYSLVDDGTLVGSLGLAGADEAARALADGQVLTNDPDSIWPDGNVHVAFRGNGPEPVTEEIVVPAHLVDWSSFQFNLVLSLAAAEEVVAANEEWIATQPDIDAVEARLHVAPIGAAITGVDLTQADVDELNRHLSDVEPNVRIAVEGQMNQQNSGTTILIVMGLALFVALAATGLSVGLAVADSRADLATLAAVGASPRMRRRVTAAQAGVIAGIGTVTGVVTGLLLGYVLGLWQGTDANFGSMWQTVVPWLPIAVLFIALPLLASGAGWLFTRSRLPVRRRMAS
ncbi:ABC transporter permease [Ruania zhangjianzhongii]|uniref:ABC transporter permease n=1 Tax=Ruania zhangjianzhongii TaxID=2603206 RepID=UPI0011C6FA2A|nr:ABC transporter permease [Ruania zhangjianzhongii]